MKEIIAVIRPQRWTATKGRLTALGLSYTQCRVYGRGRQKGLKYLARARDGSVAPTGIRYVPKRWVMVAVPDERVEEVIQAIIETNQTGSIGDGKVFVLPLETAVRVRTGELGSAVA